MKNSKKLIPVMAIVAALSMSACSKQQFVLESGTGLTAENQMSTFFVNGIAQAHKINASEICKGKDNVVSVEVQQTFVNSVLGMLTWGIYTPRQYRVMCRR